MASHQGDNEFCQKSPNRSGACLRQTSSADENDRVVFWNEEYELCPGCL